MNQKDRLEVQALMERRSIPLPWTGCWLWDASTDPKGYGKTKWKGMTRRAHRLSYEAFHGVEPGALMVMHSCDISSCVNPAHLSLGTGGENTRDSVSRGRIGRGRKTWSVAKGSASTHVFDRVTGKEVTADVIKLLVAYDPETGVFTWRERPGDHGWSRKNAGKSAGAISEHCRKGSRPKQYVRIRVYGQDFYAHRLAWLFVHGEWPGKNEIDHRDDNGLNNRIDNLRRATHAQNGHNVGLRRNNKSGVKGVHWDAQRGRWFASITIEGKSKALGRFDDLDDAVAARRAAEADYHGAFAHIQGNA